jgi:hypothetical protein
LFHLVERIAQRLLRPFSISDVFERDDGANKLAAFIPNRGTDVLDGERRAVLSPKNFIRYVMDGSIAKGGVDGTFFFWIGGSVWFGVVEDIVLGLADEFRGIVPIIRAAAGLTKVVFPCRSRP